MTSEHQADPLDPDDEPVREDASGIAGHAAESMEAAEVDAAADDDAADWSASDLDELYRETLEAMDQAEEVMQQAWQEVQGPDDDDRGGEVDDDESPDDRAAADGSSETAAVGGVEDTLAGSSRFPDDTADVEGETTIDLHAAMAAAGDDHAARLTPLQVLEAALFVGGEPLTIRRLQTLLRDRFEPEAIVDLVEELDQKYQEQLRPYGVVLKEGGYRLCLRDEYEPVRSRVYGFGPREIRLTQDHLEVLSLVAYHQPVTRDEMEEAAGRGVAGTLRQLVRRELVGIERTPDDPKNVRYVSTDRFLEVFGLGGLDELPQADELSFR